MTSLLLNVLLSSQPANQAGEWCSKKLLESSAGWRCNPPGWEENVNGHHKVITGESSEDLLSRTAAKLFFSPKHRTNWRRWSHAMPKDSTWTACIVAGKTLFEACFHWWFSHSTEFLQIGPTFIFAYFKLNLSMHFFIPLKRLLIDWRGAQSNLNIYQGNIKCMCRLTKLMFSAKEVPLGSQSWIILSQSKTGGSCVDRRMDNKMNEFKIGRWGPSLTNDPIKETLWHILFSSCAMTRKPRSFYESIDWTAEMYFVRVHFCF